MTNPTHTPARAGLAPIARPDGTLAIVAMDQRNTLRRMLTAVGRPQEPEDLRLFKVDVAEALSPSASAVLLDPEYGMPAVVEAAALAPSCATLVAVEPPERDVWNGEPRASRDPSRNAAWVRSMGGNAVKLLVQLRPDRQRVAGGPDLVAEVIDVVAAVVADAAASGVPSVVETLLYPLPGEDPLSPERRGELIVESARLLDATRPDLLKLEYPGDARRCAAVGDALSVPWALLSAGMDFEPFLDAVRTACGDGGASGFIAGRVYWKEAVAMDREERRAFLSTTGRARLERTLEAVAGLARPWREATRQR